MNRNINTKLENNITAPTLSYIPATFVIQTTCQPIAAGHLKRAIIICECITHYRQPNACCQILFVYVIYVKNPFHVLQNLQIIPVSKF